jgi:hypothetical protein
VTGIELVFLAQTKKASVLEMERKFVLFLKNELCYFIFFLHFGHTEIHSWATSTCRPSRIWVTSLSA